MGQVYVLFSRVTDPKHLELIGLVCFFLRVSIRMSYVKCNRPTAHRHPRGRMPRLGACWARCGGVLAEGHYGHE